MYILALSAFKKSNNVLQVRYKNSFPKEYLWIILIFVVISGFRYDVGVDHLSYLETYLTALKGQDFLRGRGIEEGYYFVTRAFAYLNIHPTIYFGFLSALQIGFVMFAIKDEKIIAPYVVLLIMLGGHYFTWMNGMRQMIAACTYFWGINFIKDKKFVPFLLCAIFAYLWHHSSVLMLPFYLFAYSNKVWNKNWINITVFLMCVIIGVTPTWIDRLTQLSTVLTVIGYDYYSNMMEEVLDTSNVEMFNIGPRYLLTFLSYFLVILFYPNVRKNIKAPKFDLYFKFYFIGVCLYYLFVNAGLLFLRPVYYFTIFSLPVTAYTLYYLHINRSKKRIFYLLLLVATMTFTYISCLSDYRTPIGDRKSYLYQFYFNQ